MNKVENENPHKETESSETTQVFIRREKTSVCMDRLAGGLREALTPSWWFESLRPESWPSLPPKPNLKKKKKNKDRVWRKQTGDFNSQPWKWGTQQATLRELWPRLLEESRGSCETRAPRQDPGTENKGVGVLGSSLLHCFRTSRSLALVTQ